MGGTKNFDLFVTDNDQMTFRDWRLTISGETNSNMTKIDEAMKSISDKASDTYSKNEIDNRLDNLISADDIDAICGGIIEVADDEVKF